MWWVNGAENADDKIVKSGNCVACSFRESTRIVREMYVYDIELNSPMEREKGQI